MAAEVEKISYALFDKRSIPWWGTGTSDKELTVAGRYLTPDEAAATFPWSVELHPTYQRLGDGTYREVEDSQQVTLIADDPTTFEDHQKVLGVVGKLYSVDFQPRDMIDFATELVDNHGFVFDTVGDLRGHTIIFCSMKIQATGVEVDESLTGKHEWYVLLTNPYNGNGSLRADIVPIRTVCKNTHSFNLKQAVNTWSVRHVGDVSSRVGEARRTLGLITAYEKEYAETAEKLAAASCEMDLFEEYAEKLLPVEQPTLGPRVRASNEEAQVGLKANFLHSPTIADEMRFTKWGALNAMTEWSEWLYEPRTDRRTAAKDRRMLRSLYAGPQQKFAQRAFDLVTR